MSISLPPNCHVSTHPCMRAKISQLRSKSTDSRQFKTLINEIGTFVGYEALASGLTSTQGGTDESPLNYPYSVDTISPSSITLVPILRSGLSLVDALQSVLPYPVPVHHLGLYREKTTLQPVEYYNNLPYHRSQQPVAGSLPETNVDAVELAIIVDPVIATGATACAAIETLREWGVKRIIMVAVMGCLPGLERAAGEWPEGVEIYCAAVDGELNEKGMILPGLGDVGDRLYLTIGK